MYTTFQYSLSPSPRNLVVVDVVNVVVVVVVDVVVVLVAAVVVVRENVMFRCHLVFQADQSPTSRGAATRTLPSQRTLLCVPRCCLEAHGVGEATNVKTTIATVV